MTTHSIERQALGTYASKLLPQISNEQLLLKK